MITTVDFLLNLSSPALSLWKILYPQHPLLRINKSAVTLVVLFEMSCSCSWKKQWKTDLYPPSPCHLCCYRSPPYPAQPSLFPPRLLPYLVPSYLKGSPSTSFHSCCSSLKSSPVASFPKWWDLNCTQQASASKQVMYAVGQQHCLFFYIIFLLHLKDLITFQLLLSNVLMFSCNCL